VTPVDDADGATCAAWRTAFCAVGLTEAGGGVIPVGKVAKRSILKPDAFRLLPQQCFGKESPQKYEKRNIRLAFYAESTPANHSWAAKVTRRVSSCQRITAGSVKCVALVVLMR